MYIYIERLTGFIFFKHQELKDALKTKHMWLNNLAAESDPQSLPVTSTHVFTAAHVALSSTRLENMAADGKSNVEIERHYESQRRTVEAL